MSLPKLYLNNDNVLELDALKNGLDDSFINDATVTCTLQDEDGTEVAGESWPISMLYVASSDGKYRCTLEDGLMLSNDTKYVAIVNVDAGADLIGEFRLKLYAEYRYA